jgi:hypothetical protein
MDARVGGWLKMTILFGNETKVNVFTMGLIRKTTDQVVSWMTRVWGEWVGWVCMKMVVIFTSLFNVEER